MLLYSFIPILQMRNEDNKDTTLLPKITELGGGGIQVKTPNELF